MATTHTYTRQEELVNAITHGFGALLSIAALVLLIIFSSLYGTALHVVSFTIFGATMLLLYLASTLVHSFPEGKLKDLFEIFDHSSIYLFIAGTYTPVLLTVIRGATGWVLFGVVWGTAALGLVFKAFLTKKFLFTSTLLYIAMGWLIVFAWRPLLLHASTDELVFLLVGGVLYTVGTVFYVWRGFKYHHAVWHLFVLGGSVFHFFAVLSIVM
ncbi:hemolysin D [Gordoniibacillus kamchatkensis]|uniref:Hemolysin D n=1 Tax=Gordoniibacillus kamchatkensis TaxID=1590651 RepID=A0ABR5ACJ4_9BACL|nr:hemolysin III family protein [Paenibacillus sp. VKM B-2647]KIL38769.1 hemolysin D [Paenibacillus sp. VKM B-2647]